MKSIRLWFVVCGVLGLLACGSDSGGNAPADGGTSSQTDADTEGKGPKSEGPDAGAGTESTAEAGTDEPSTEDANVEPPPGHSKEHDDACRAYCQAQFDTGCPGAFTIARCVNACTGVIESILACDDQETALNQCMAEKPLFCDAQGNPAVKYADCATEIDAYGACLDAL